MDVSATNRARNAAVQILNQKRQVRSAEVAKKADVSKRTARRALKSMEYAGILARKTPNSHIWHLTSESLFTPEQKEQIRVMASVVGDKMDEDDKMENELAKFKTLFGVQEHENLTGTSFSSAMTEG